MASNYVVFVCSNNAFSPLRGQAIIRSITNLLTHFSEISNKVWCFSFMEMHLEMSSTSTILFRPQMLSFTLWISASQTFMAFFNCHPRWPHCRWRRIIKSIVLPHAHRTPYKVRTPGHFHIVLTGRSPYKNPAMKCFAVFLVMCLALGANAYFSHYDKNNDGVADYADRNLDGKVTSLFCLLDGVNDLNIHYMILSLVHFQIHAPFLVGRK